MTRGGEASGPVDRPDATPDAADAAALALDRRRTRLAWTIAAVGSALGLVIAVVTGAFGASGRAGLATFLLVSAAAAALGALYATVTLLIDDLRGRRVTRRRPIAAFALFAAAAMLMAMVVGVGG